MFTFNSCTISEKKHLKLENFPQTLADGISFHVCTLIDIIASELAEILRKDEKKTLFNMVHSFLTDCFLYMRLCLSHDGIFKAFQKYFVDWFCCFLWSLIDYFLL